MKSIYVILFIISLIGISINVYQIYNNTYHYDIFETKNRAVYNIQRNEIQNSNDADSLKQIALNKLESSRESFIEKSKLAESNNFALILVTIILLINLVVIIVLFFKGGFGRSVTKG